MLGAFQRGRQIPDVTTLLRVLLIHLAKGCGQRETAVRGELRFLASTGAMHHRINTPVVNSALDYRSGRNPATASRDRTRPSPKYDDWHQRKIRT